MISRQVQNFARKIPIRALSTEGRNIDLTIDNEGIAVMKLQKPPVNGLNRQIMKEMKNTIEDIEKEEKCKGLVITSSIPKIFSAGVDLSELRKPEPENVRLFWQQLQELFLTVYGSNTTTTFAINGHTAAGGLLLAMTADFRVMVNDGKARIGFNDTAVGIKPLRWICEVINRVMGFRNAEIAIISSNMYSPEEALKVQMIDELANNNEEAIEKCKTYIRRFDNIPRHIQSATKRQLREDIIRYVEENREKDQEMFMANILDPYAQQKIDGYVQKLKQKKV